MNRDEARETSGKGRMKRGGEPTSMVHGTGKALAENVVFTDGINLGIRCYGGTCAKEWRGLPLLYWLVGNFGIRDCW